jgi:hypothetical protein
MAIHVERDQLESLVHLLVRARSGLEKVEQDGDGATAYMHARNARIDINVALRRLHYPLGDADVYPLAPDTKSPH